MLRVAVICAFLISVTLSASALSQIPTTIEEINFDLANWNGAYVMTTGIWVSTVDGTFLWTSIGKASETHSLFWNQRLQVTDGGGMPLDPETYTYSEVQVVGTISPWIDNSLPAESRAAGSINVVSFVELVPPPNLIAPATQPTPFQSWRSADCDSCHFVLIISGYDDIEYWNDVQQKYDYKRNYENVCEDNIVVLFADSTLDPAVIPKGDTTGAGDFDSGGAFPASEANVTRAFDYIEQRMNALGCTTPTFQLHTTGHGGGYHTDGTQQGYTRAFGYGDGIADLSGDEATKFHENDLVFCREVIGHRDTDGDGIKDVWIGYIPNDFAPPDSVLTVIFDQNNDMIADLQVGIDDNFDGYIDKTDGSWSPPDLNRSGSIDSVGFDESLGLGGEAELTDDELAALLAALQAATSLTKDSTRVELAQCFSGGFHDDLEATAGEAATAATEGQVSYSSRRRGYNIYQYPFIEALKSGLSWADAHQAAVDSVTSEVNLRETPEYRANTNPTSTDVPTTSQQPSLTRLHQNYPNPFNPSTVIRYDLAQSGNVTIRVHNVRGDLVRVLENRYRDAGSYEVRWDGNNTGGSRVASGVYFYRLHTPALAITRRMVLLK